MQVSALFTKQHFSRPVAKNAPRAAFANDVSAFWKRRAHHAPDLAKQRAFQDRCGKSCQTAGDDLFIRGAGSMNPKNLLVLTANADTQAIMHAILSRHQARGMRQEEDLMEHSEIAQQASLTDWQNSPGFSAPVTQLRSWFPQP